MLEFVRVMEDHRKVEKRKVVGILNIIVDNLEIVRKPVSLQTLQTPISHTQSFYLQLPITLCTSADYSQHYGYL